MSTLSKHNKPVFPDSLKPSDLMQGDIHVTESGPKKIHEHYRVSGHVLNHGADPSRLDLYVPDQPMGYYSALGKALVDKGGVYANALWHNFFLEEENHHLIPESWIGKRVVLPGTNFVNKNDTSICVRVLYPRDREDVFSHLHCGQGSTYLDNKFAIAMYLPRI